ncbi:MAG: DUF4129 domain-containing protein [Planctomycetaceae bacterium]|nr:DUF4129 domain-containing protein [Planctomycetaceae bacterium]
MIPSRALAELTDQQATESAKNTLGGRARFPFYDRASDDVRQLNVVSPADDELANRNTRWAGKKPKAPTPKPPRATSTWFGTLLEVVGLTALVISIGLLAWLIAKAFLKNETTETVVSKVVETSRSRDVDRVEALPFQLRKPTGDFLAEAQRLYEAGNFSEAVIYLYSHLLVQLDRHHVIRLAKGKTNRQYLRETRSRPRLRETLERTMVAFEDVFFGHHELTRERFEECWRRLGEFHAELERQERAAA